MRVLRMSAFLLLVASAIFSAQSASVASGFRCDEGGPQDMCDKPRCDEVCTSDGKCMTCGGELSPDSCPDACVDGQGAGGGDIISAHHCDGDCCAYCQCTALNQ